MRSDSNKRLHRERREKALKEALSMERALEKRMHSLQQPKLVCACGNSAGGKGFRRSPKRHPKTKEWWYVCEKCNLAAPERYFTAKKGALSE